ncbi:threonine synthase [Halomonas sp. MCCC 1A11062]|uniref:threonine synthase n=1 Tax=Halomonas sp. MCCC 1A11062 TaxID=2733485 RepID=UPI001F3FC287|nr:threonine synthase [Halomonas sp. MCCC 1A11062]MCE8037699.1 threonine synthase [Halomonas sp. MCCC 1A11062]
MSEPRPYRYATHLACPRCEADYALDSLRQLCACGSPLLVRYDLTRLAATWRPEQLAERPWSLWRYHELLPLARPEAIVSLGEVVTPLVELPRLGDDMRLPRLVMKDEGLLPTGSFKARGAAVGISRARELGVTHLAMPTNGNAGAAWALYAARAGIQATIAMPENAPYITRQECALAGAHLSLVDGLISDAGRQVAGFVAATGVFDASTLKEPYRIEGKKTMGLELAEQLGWQLPDVILYPTGGGVGLIGIYKALQELQAIGWVSGPLPRLVAVQAKGCAPIVRAWQEGARESRFWEQSRTRAFGINVPKALGDFLVLEALYATEGRAIAVSEAAIDWEQRRAAQLEGTFVCPEGAAVLAAARELSSLGEIPADARVVALNTGAGIKYPDNRDLGVPRLAADEALPTPDSTARRPS